MQPEVPVLERLGDLAVGIGYSVGVISALDHIHIYAADPEASLAFYRRHFGAETLGTLPNRAGTGNHFLILGGQYLVISAFPPSMEPREAPEPGDGALRTGYGVAHFGLQTDDLEGLVATLERADVHVHAPPTGQGAIRYAYISAPDGVVIELVQLVLPRKLAPLRPVFNGVNWAIHATRRAFARQLFKKKR